MEKYKPALTLFSLLTIIAILFPPVIWETSTKIYETGYSFILNIPKYKNVIAGRINYANLLIELLLIAVVCLLYQMNYEKIRIWYNKFTR